MHTPPDRDRSSESPWPLAVLVSTLAGCLAPGTLPPASAKPARMHVLIDADSANEIDDLFAIARAAYEPGIELVALTGSQYVTQPGAPVDSAAHSHRLNQRLLAALGRTGVPIAQGSDQPMVDVDSPQDSPAARLIIEKARAATSAVPLHLVTLGAVTNVASAIKMAPDIVPRIRLWTIMLRREKSGWNRDEFNANNDQVAVDVLLTTRGLNLVIMTGTASRSLIFTRAEVDQRFAGRPGVGSFLVNYWDEYVARMTWPNRIWDERRAWRMWDVALIEALADPALATKDRVPPPALINGAVLANRVEVFTAIDAAAMSERFWSRLAPGGPPR